MVGLVVEMDRQSAESRQVDSNAGRGQSYNRKVKKVKDEERKERMKGLVNEESQDRAKTKKKKACQVG